MAEEIQKKGNPLGLTAMVLGIVAAVLAFIPCIGWLGFIPGVLAIIFGALSLKKVNAGEADGKGMSIAGLVCGLVAVIINIAMIVIFAGAVAAVGGAIDGYDSVMDEAFDEYDNAMDEFEDAMRELERY